jgi:hypothetical protein
MGKPYSDDLRERVVAAIEAGHTRVKVAEPYNMALSLRLPLPTETRYDQGSFQSWRLTNIIRERYTRDLPPYMQS